MTDEPAQPRIRVMVVDDHTLFRRGLTALLASDPRIEVVAEAGDASQAQRLVAEAAPQVMLLDNHLPGVRGVDALPALAAGVPGLRVLMLTMSEDEADLAAALRGGACGYLLKTADGEELVAAILRAAQGQSTFSDGMMGKLAGAFRAVAAPVPAPTPAPVDPLDELSPRERQIVGHIAEGASNKEIARTLGIAETTVKIHVQHILRKLGLGSRVQVAVALASRGPGR